MDVLFLHDCCSSGYAFLKDYKKEFPQDKITTISYFNVHEQQLHIKYGFKMDDLKKYSYIVVGDKVFKRSNNDRPKR